MNALLEQVRETLGAKIAEKIEGLPGRLREIEARHQPGGISELIATTDADRKIRIPIEIRNSFVAEDVTDFSMFDSRQFFPTMNMSSASAVAESHIPDKPSTSMLKAMELPELADDARQQLAVAVEDLLGYTPLRKDAGAPSRLQRILAELEIEAFDQASVDAYKRKMRAHFQAKANERIAEEARLHAEQMVKFPTLDGGYVMARRGTGWGYERTEVEWASVALQGYSKPVPEHVLRKAMQIKQREPAAEFFVDELREERRTLDPFLIVRIGSDSAAIEVWDEPEFEKTL